MSSVRRALRPLLGSVTLALIAVLAARPVLADAVDDLQKPEKAVKKFEEATTKAPNDEESWYNLGLAYSKLQRWPDAVSALTKATTLNASRSQGWYFLAKAQAKAGQGEASVKSFEKAIELGVVEAKADIGQAYFAAGRYDEAIKSYKESLEAEGVDKGATYNQIGVAYLKKGDTANAVKWFERNVEIAPNSPTTYYNLGQMYRKAANESQDMAMWKKSAEMLVKAAEMDPKNTTAMVLAGEALYISGDKTAARTWIDRYLAADPDGKKSGAKVFELAKGYKAELK
jgi:tetratricopeptide (TPR) repeat protein